MSALLRKLLALDLRDWHDLFLAQAALLRAQRRLKREPVGGLVVRDGTTGDAVSGDPARAQQLALALERAADHGLFRPYCLVRAIALRELLIAHEIQGSTVRVGVRQSRGRFLAHAWVRWGDMVLGDRADHVAGFTEVDDIRVLQRS